MEKRKKKSHEKLQTHKHIMCMFEDVTERQLGTCHVQNEKKKMSVKALENVWHYSGMNRMNVQLKLELESKS